MQPSVIDLAEQLPEIKDMLSRSLRGDIEIKVGVPRRPCTVKVDPSEFELALLNLAVNARDAMPSGGTLTITAKPVVLRGKASEEGLAGDFVAIRVADTGSGIPADVLPRVFEPFFTTKDIGKGTGLGLSQVYGFAHQSGGAATIASSARRGTVVTLFLPRTWETPALPHEPSAAVAAKKHAGTVLLVEDNAEVAEVGKAYFEELGYKVKQAASAQAGLDLVEGERDIALVFSDILMPGGMNGLELADAIRRRFPHIVVLLTTGYSSSAQDAVRQGFAVLQKPYDIAALDRALREAQAAGEPREPTKPASAALGRLDLQGPRHRARETDNHLFKIVQRIEARLRGDVRRHDDVGEFQKLVVVAARRVVERIEREAAEPARAQRFEQRRAIDHIGARDIDQARARPHAPNSAPPIRFCVAGTLGTKGTTQSLSASRSAIGR